MIDTSNPRFNITGSVNWPSDGDSIDKVGIIGGWTTGEVTSSCTTYDVGENPEYRLLCGYRADYRSDFGDSGGPVFTRTGGGNVTLMGVNLGHSGTGDSGNGLFSSMGAIFYTTKDNLFSQFQVYNKAMSGSIEGPLEAPPEEYCTWYATNVSGGVWPYSYQWSGALSGTNISVTGSISEPGETLYLTVTDAESNQLNRQLYIPVEEDAEWCFN